MNTIIEDEKGIVDFLYQSGKSCHYATPITFFTDATASPDTFFTDA